MIITRSTTPRTPNQVIESDKLRELQVAIESLKIKWYKRGKSLTTWDEALEELEDL